MMLSFGGRRWRRLPRRAHTRRSQVQILPPPPRKGQESQGAPEFVVRVAVATAVECRTMSNRFQTLGRPPSASRGGVPKIPVIWSFGQPNKGPLGGAQLTGHLGFLAAPASDPFIDPLTQRRGQTMQGADHRLSIGHGSKPRNI